MLFYYLLPRSTIRAVSNLTLTHVHRAMMATTMTTMAKTTSSSASEDTVWHPSHCCVSSVAKALPTVVSIVNCGMHYIFIYFILLRINLKHATGSKINLHCITSQVGLCIVKVFIAECAGFDSPWPSA